MASQVAVLTMAVDVRAARIREAEQAGDLVEALPRRVIQRGATTSILQHVFPVRRGAAARETIRASVSLGNGPNCS